MKFGLRSSILGLRSSVFEIFEDFSAGCLQTDRYTKIKDLRPKTKDQSRSL